MNERKYLPHSDHLGVLTSTMLLALALSRLIEVVAVSTDNSLSPVKEFLVKSRVDFTVLFDEKKAVSRQYKVFSMPTTFLIDRNGFIVEKYYGEYEWTEPDVRKQIEKLL